MKRILTVWALCALASIGSFASLLIVDRSLGLPLPYSIPLAFASMLVAGPMLQLVAAAVWPRRRIVVTAPVQRPVVTAPAAVASKGRAPRRAAQGVVIFDMATIEAARPHAA